MQAYKMWKSFDISERVDVLFSRARREEIERHNEEVRQNREMLRTLSEAVLYLVKQEILLRGHDESSASFNKGNYRELLECLAKFDSVFERRFHGRLADSERASGGGVFTGVSADIQNDPIECIDMIIQDQIDKEIQECTFLTIQVDETTDVSTKEQLSAIIRLDRNGEVERFLKFVNVSQDRSAPAITAIVKEILNRYGESLKEKLVMQTYDGATVMSGHIGGVQTLLRQDYPFAYFFHCAAHRLNLVLCQSASRISHAKVFFANVSAFSSFTSVSSKRKELFRSHDIDIPSHGETKWYYRSRTIGVIFEQYEPLVNVLEEIEDKPQSWDDATVTQASGLLQYLNSFLFCFLLCLFNKILQHSTILYSILQNRSTDFSLGVRKVKGFATFLTELRSDAAFDELFRVTVDMVGQPSSRSDKKPNYKQLYFEILDTTITMLNDRFADCESFAFLDLVNPYFFGGWKDNVPKNKLQLLKEKYVSLFICQHLKASYRLCTRILISTKKTQWNSCIIFTTAICIQVYQK